MKKIRVLLTNFTVTGNLVKVAVGIAKQCSATLHVFFLHPSLELTGADTGPRTLKNIPGVQSSNDKTFFEEGVVPLNDHLEYVSNICQNAGIGYNIKPEQEVDISKLIVLSAFDDLIIARADETDGSYNITDLLAGLLCPVYLISNPGNKVENIILTYDGSLSSIHAIKKFSQLFPGLLHLPCHFVHVVSDENDEFPREKNIRSWLPSLFSNVEFKILYGDIRNELVNYINQLPGSLAVLGSTKNKFSGMSHKRIIHAVIDNGTSDVFIA